MYLNCFVSSHVPKYNPHTNETTHESTGVPLSIIQAWPCELALTNDQKRSIFRPLFRRVHEQSILKFISPIRKSEQICHDGIQPTQEKKKEKFNQISIVSHVRP